MATGTAVTHAAITWTATAEGADFDRYDIQRYDTDSGWQPIAEITDETVEAFDDFEGRRGVTSLYRMRAWNRFGAASAWTGTDDATPTAVGCGVLSFTTNEDPALNLEYEDRGPRRYDFPEHVEWTEMIGRGFTVAFRELEDRGDELAWSLMIGDDLLPLTTGLGRDAFTPMLSLARASLSYVCVLDGDGNRWFCSLRTPSGEWRAAAATKRAHAMPVTGREITRTPSTPDMEAP